MKIENCFQGILIAHTVSHLVRTVMNMHLVLSKPLTKAAVLALCRLTELLKVKMGKIFSRGSHKCCNILVSHHANNSNHKQNPVRLLKVKIACQIACCESAWSYTLIETKSCGNLERGSLVTTCKILLFYHWLFKPPNINSKQFAVDRF